MNDSRDLLSTLFTKSFGLISSFGLVVISTFLLGAEGRGFISLTITDAALIAIFSNVISGSSAMYYLNKFGEEKVFYSALFWIIGISFIGACLVNFLHPTHFWLLLSLSIILSTHSLIFNQLFANQNFMKGNLLTLLVQVLFFLVLLALWWMNYPIDWITYFEIQMVIWSLTTLFFLKPLKFALLKKNELRAMLNYGFRNELSYLLQFISYRLSYFFIFYKLGIEALGVFGVMVILAESVWVISRSFSSVSFSKQLQDEGESNSIRRTNQYAWYTFGLTAIAILALLILPNEWYIAIFSKEFSELKTILIVVSPGILLVAISTIFGHYFAAKNRQGILLFKSFIGVLVTVSLTPLFISLYGIWGAALAMSISYITSSVVLIIAYLRRIYMLPKTI